MQRFQGKIFLSVFSILFLNFFFLRPVFASTLNVNQSKVRLSIPPGQAKNGTIEVENPSADTLIVKIYTEDWSYSASRDGTKDFYPAGTMPRSCARWISFVPGEFVIAPASKQVINYTVKVPADAEGTNTAVLFFESTIGRGGAAQESVGMNLVVRVGTLFFIEVQGKNDRKAQIDNFKIQQNKGEAEFALSVDLKNTGTDDIVTDSSFHVMDDAGMIYSRGQFNTVYCLPGDEAVLTATSKKDLSEGTYNLVMTFNLGKSQAEAGLAGGPVVVKEVTISVDKHKQVKQTGAMR